MRQEWGYLWAAKSNLREWLVQLFHERDKSLLNSLVSRTFELVCLRYGAWFLETECRIVLLKSVPFIRPHLKQSDYGTVTLPRYNTFYIIHLSTYEKSLFESFLEDIISFVPFIVAWALKILFINGKRSIL